MFTYTSSMIQNVMVKNNIIHNLIKLKQMDSSIDLERFISGVIKSYEIDKMETKTPDFVGRKRY